MSENDICGDLLGNTMDIMVHIKEKVSIINATFFPSLLIQLFCIHLIATQDTTLSVMQRRVGLYITYVTLTYFFMPAQVGVILLSILPLM